ncbi:MAG: hypothetical protein F6K40_07030 [Okeania sp. SIO3I5]|nr:hypothetical protein [Okeania sp. SIO3I5]NEQ36050.1 hypothetical protein [Okeania sp. SIO3I5]
MTWNVEDGFFVVLLMVDKDEQQLAREQDTPTTASKGARCSHYCSS